MKSYQHMLVGAALGLVVGINAALCMASELDGRRDSAILFGSTAGLWLIVLGLNVGCAALHRQKECQR